jgi:hypothetical protein
MFGNRRSHSANYRNGPRLDSPALVATADQVIEYDSGQPIIKLAMTDMPTKKFGKVPRPDFQIGGWDEPSGEVDIVLPDDPKGEFENSIPF